jgi:hypothetical protein
VKNAEPTLLPPSLLAIAYAPVVVQARLRWLLTLDQRLSDVLARASEPMIAQLRLSWWRDGINAAPEKRPKGEPLFAALIAIGDDQTLMTASRSLVDAIEVIALGNDPAEITDGYKQRVLALCSAYADWIGDHASNREQVERIERWWQTPDSDMPKPVARILRPLSILALAEQLDDESRNSTPLRLNWHALTGR